MTKTSSLTSRLHGSHAATSQASTWEVYTLQRLITLTTAAPARRHRAQLACTHLKAGAFQCKKKECQEQTSVVSRHLHLHLGRSLSHIPQTWPPALSARKLVLSLIYTDVTTLVMAYMITDVMKRLNMDLQDRLDSNEHRRTVYGRTREPHAVF